MTKLKDEEITPIANAYIFYKLYTNEFLKSKPVSFAKYDYKMQNKIMHIIKSAINKEIQGDGTVFCKTTFFHNVATLTFKESLYADYTTKMMLHGFFSIINRNIDANVSDIISFNAMNNAISIRINFRYDHSRIKEDLDCIVNAIMFIPIAINLFSEYACNYILTLNSEDRVFTAFDVYTFIYPDFHYGNPILTEEFSVDRLKEIRLNGVNTYPDFINLLGNNRLTTLNFFREILIQNNLLLNEVLVNDEEEI